MSEIKIKAVRCVNMLGDTWVGKKGTRGYPLCHRSIIKITLNNLDILHKKLYKISPEKNISQIDQVDTI